MKYLILNEELYAYDKDSELSLVYVPDDNDWDLADIDLTYFLRRKSTLILSEKDAMTITAGHPPFQFIEEYNRGKEFLSNK